MARWIRKKNCVPTWFCTHVGLGWKNCRCREPARAGANTRAEFCASSSLAYDHWVRHGECSSGSRGDQAGGSSVDKSGMVLATIIVLLITSTQATAQKVYKCKGPGGSTVYQQVQCAHEDGEVVKIHAQPSQATIAEAQAKLHAWEEAEVQRSYEQAMQDAYPVVERYEPAPAAQHSRPPPAPAPSAPPLNASRFDPERVGFSGSRGYESLRHRSSNANTTAIRTGPGYTEPSRVQDQYGNGYIRPPGSAVVIDEKTGRPCLAVGGTIRCD